MTPETALSPAPRARKARSMTKHTCHECSIQFSAVREAKFCSNKCKDKYHNLNAKRGKVAMPLLLGWRGSKSGQKTQPKKGEVHSFAFRELCALADEWNREDDQAGRYPAWKSLIPKMNDGWRAMDLTT